MLRHREETVRADGDGIDSRLAEKLCKARAVAGSFSADLAFGAVRRGDNVGDEPFYAGVIFIEQLG